MKKLLGVALGIVTSIGGFLDAGSIATSAQATFGNALLWSVVLGTVCVIFLVEMSGRFSIASRHWGFPLFLASLAITCFGAALELSLASAYTVAQPSAGAGART